MTSSQYNSDRSDLLHDAKWIDEWIKKRECCRFVARRNASSDIQLCGCGRRLAEHQYLDPGTELGDRHSRWHPDFHTCMLPTDAYGIIEFQGGPHPTKARYARLAHNTDPAIMLHLLSKVWKLKEPNLVLSVIGGIANFDLQPKLRSVLQNGLLKAAQTTGAWIITSGLDTGVTRIVGDAVRENIHLRGSQMVVLGIAPWCAVDKSESLIGANNVCPYYTARTCSDKSTLNNDHNYFLLADNGSKTDILANDEMRRNLETFLGAGANDDGNLTSTVSDSKTLHGIPVVACLIEGGSNSFGKVYQLVSSSVAPIPVVVCDGTGRAADILAFALQVSKNKVLSDSVAEKLSEVVQSVFNVAKDRLESLITEIRMCVSKSEFITVFRMGEGPNSDPDVAILTTLLKTLRRRKGINSYGEVMLTMMWDRVDIARSVFNDSIIWTSEELNWALRLALLNDRVEFVSLLLQKGGLSLREFLTFKELEYLYNADRTKTFHGLAVKVIPGLRILRYTLAQIGEVIEALVGSAYNHKYTSKSVRSILSALDRQQSRAAQAPRISDKLNLLPNSLLPSTLTRVANGVHLRSNRSTESKLTAEQTVSAAVVELPVCRYPYTDLMIWAVLTRRYDMAWFFMQSGEESIAKALFAVKLLRCVRRLFDSDQDFEYVREVKLWRAKFEHAAVSMQEHCFKHDQRQTRRLLTYELVEFSNHTCLSLAQLCKSKAFLGTVCTQNIMNDLWFGGFKTRDTSSALKIILMLFTLPLPPLFFMLIQMDFVDFKTKKELADQPQTKEEFFAMTERDADSNDVSDSENSHIHEECEDVETDFVVPSCSRRFDVRSQHNNTSNAFSKNICKPGSSEDKSQLANPYSISLVSAPLIAALPTSFFLPSESPAVSQRRFSYGALANAYNLTADNTNFFWCENRDNFLLIPDLNSGSVEIPLNFLTKVYEFFAAPITRYFAYFISYIIFICLFIHCVVVRLDRYSLAYREMLVYFYCIVAFGDVIIEVSRTSGKTFTHRVSYHLRNNWNRFDVAVNFFSISGIIIRGLSIMSSFPQWFFWMGHNLLVVACGLWMLRVFELLLIWRAIGPYLYMVVRMCRRMLPLALVIIVPLVKFGVVRHAIMRPNTTSFAINQIKDITLKPYFMLYGEVYAGEIDPEHWSTLEDSAGQLESVDMPLYFIVPIYMVIYLLVSIIVILSMVIASFNDVYGMVKEQSELVYKYLRYSIIIEYESRSLFPPPLTFLSWIARCGRYLYHVNCCKSSCRQCCRRQRLHHSKYVDENGQGSVVEGLKLFLDENAVEQVHDFEEECVEEYFRHMERSKLQENSARLETLAQLGEVTRMRIDDVGGRQRKLATPIQQIDFRTIKLEEQLIEQKNLIQLTMSSLDKLKKDICEKLQETNCAIALGSNNSEAQHGVPLISLQSPTHDEREGGALFVKTVATAAQESDCTTLPQTLDSMMKYQTNYIARSNSTSTVSESEDAVVTKRSKRERKVSHLLTQRLNSLSIGANSVVMREYTSICDALDLELEDLQQSCPGSPIGEDTYYERSLFVLHDDSDDVRRKRDDHLYKIEEQERERNLRELCKSLRILSEHDPHNFALKTRLRQLSFNDQLFKECDHISSASDDVVENNVALLTAWELAADLQSVSPVKSRSHSPCLSQSEIDFNPLNNVHSAVD